MTKRTKQGVRDLNDKHKNGRVRDTVPCIPYTHVFKRVDDVQVCIKCGYVIQDPIPWYY